MSYLKLLTVDIPSLIPQGARYVVIAIYEDWREGEVTNDPRQIPHIERELRKRFLNRFDSC